MSAKRTPPDDEIMAMAAELRPHLKAGETIVPFIRRNRQRLRELVEEESWATLARVVTTLGLTYSSGKPWTARYISNEFTRAVKSLERQQRSQRETLAQQSISTAETAAGQGVWPDQVKPYQNGPSAAPEPLVSHASSAPALPEKRFVFKRTPRLGPPRALTEEELARREATNERLFGKK
jgi:hypothetical protein